jgi:predicted O-methyltransferase YrrM
MANFALSKILVSITRDGTMDMYDPHNGWNEKPIPYVEFSVETMPAKLAPNDQFKREVFNAMDELEGWCSQFKASILIDTVLQLEARKIVEIGVWGGKSLVPMAFALRKLGGGKIYGIDPWDNVESAEGMDGVNKEWWSAVDHEAIYQGLVGKIAKFNLEDYIELLRCTSKEAPVITDIDILHIDGNHSEEASFHDVTKFVPLVRSGGLIIFDDTTWGTTSRAVEWLDSNCMRITEFHDNCDWGIWRKR